MPGVKPARSGLTRAGAARSGHMTANLLARGMRSLHRPVELFIVHIELGREDETFREIQVAQQESGQGCVGKNDRL